MIHDHINDIALTLAYLIIVVSIVLAVLHRRGTHRHRDPQRLFTWDQKKIALRHCHFRCEHKSPFWFRCKKTTHLEADHIVPWSRGGRTDMKNLQILCHEHNRRKLASMPSLIYRWRLYRRRRKY